MIYNGDYSYMKKIVFGNLSFEFEYDDLNEIMSEYNAEFYENRDGSYYIDSSIEEAFEIINRIFPNNYELIGNNYYEGSFDYKDEYCDGLVEIVGIDKNHSIFYAYYIGNYSDGPNLDKPLSSEKFHLLFEDGCISQTTSEKGLICDLNFIQLGQFKWEHKKID
tara:strand:- start:75 stop:566 length:492 start_codon:yes stop_codon:yes gene_type:complete